MEPEIYEVIFLDDDKITVLDRQRVVAGNDVVYKGEIPVKAPTAQEKYTFKGWMDEEKLKNVNENLVFIALYEVEVNQNSQDAMYNASLENAQEANLNETLEAGKKVEQQKKALEKDSRSTAEIVSDIMQNGKTEIGMEANKDNIDR